MATRRRAAGEGGLFKRADGMWCGVVEIPTVDGTRRQKRVYSKDYANAVEKLRSLKDDVANGVVAASASMTVARWLDYWLTDIKGPKVRPKTRQFYEEAVRLHITPRIGAKRLDKLTAQEVRAMLADIATSRNRQRSHQVLDMALQAAVRDGIIRRNITDAVDKPTHLAATRSAFTATQARDIIRHAIATDGVGGPLLATRWAAAFLSGARQSELLGLEWSRVDLDVGTADLSWQLQQLTKVHGCGVPVDGAYPCGRTRPSYCPASRWDFPAGYEHRDCYKSLVWTRPKTKTGVRVVPLVPGLVEMLRHQQQIPGPNPHGLVWHHSDGRPISPTDDHEAWQQLLRAAGITEDGQTIPLHSARHSTATMLQDAGVSEEVRMAIMGQSSVAAHRGYIHVDQTRAREALAGLGSLLPDAVAAMPTDARSPARPSPAAAD